MILLILFALLVYVLIGVGWSLFVWHLMSKKIVKKYTGIRKLFLDQHKIEGRVIPENLAIKWYEHMRVHDPASMCRLPKVEQHIDTIFLNIILWPAASIAWTISDVINPFLREIAWSSAIIYEKIAEKASKHVDDKKYIK